MDNRSYPQSCCNSSHHGVARSASSKRVVYAAETRSWCVAQLRSVPVDGSRTVLPHYER